MPGFEADRPSVLVTREMAVVHLDGLDAVAVQDEVRAAALEGDHPATGVEGGITQVQLEGLTARGGDDQLTPALQQFLDGLHLHRHTPSPWQVPYQNLPLP